jgi:hypothetical protein
LWRQQVGSGAHAGPRGTVVREKKGQALTLFKNTKKRSNFRSLKASIRMATVQNALAFIFRTDQNPARKSLMEPFFLRKSDAKQGESNLNHAGE